ncbi:Gfo/Idh/MocA family protein, partial [Bacteroidota bacterium]
GCGNRGTGAAMNYLKAGPNLQLAAMADIFEDKMARSRTKLKEEMNVQVPDDKCYIGFDAYKKIMDSDVDIIIQATPPYFRPLHFAAAVESRKHVFMEKPLGVDPVGVRSIISSAKKAEAIGLTVVTGTQKHHMPNYIEAYEKVLQGAIGEIVAANCYYNVGQLWYKKRQTGWSEMEWMLRDWVNWAWLSGDHIVEQHIHNIDVINWFMGEKFPVKAVSFGSRQRRITGNQYDNFSTDFVYEGNIHEHSMCRQINGCANQIEDYIIGTKGYTDCESFIKSLDDKEIWKFSINGGNDKQVSHRSGLDQEHINMITAIRSNKPLNTAEFTAKSTLTAIMGRISAYTGKEVTWDEVMKSNLRLGPENVTKFDSSEYFDHTIPVPGEE